MTLVHQEVSGARSRLALPSPPAATVSGREDRSAEARPPSDANRLAHESIREQLRQAGTGRDRETAKGLLRHTTADLRLRGEKAPQRLRAWHLNCREPSGLLPTMQR
jgi:hypothetical protein